MEIKQINIFLHVLILGLLVVSCRSQICTNLSKPLDKKILSTKSLDKFIKYNSINEVYLINPIDNAMILDINNLYYYKKIDSSYVFVFDSFVFLDKSFIVIIHNGIVERHQCADVYQICEMKQGNKYSIEIRDSLLQFNSLSYGTHKIDFSLNSDSIGYKYEDTIAYPKFNK